MGHPYALDFNAVMTMGNALGADLEMLADVLPAAEADIIANLTPDTPTD